MVIFKKFILSVSLVMCCLFSFSQDRNKIGKADAYHDNYQFDKAIELYRSLLSNATDSSLIITLKEKIVECENGINMLQYTSSPTIVADSTFSAKDFYLYLPYLKDRSWLPSPSPFAKGVHEYYSAVLLPDNSTAIYYSAPDEKGSWNIYHSTLNPDTGIWSAPEPLNDQITSAGDEIFPMIGANGKELYFASNGHYGMGGYDLYVTRWDESLKTWGMPENLGFPYSSTGDDLFFMNTPDGRFSIIGTNRGMDRNSVRLVVTEYAPTQIKKSLSDLPTIRHIASLSVKDDFIRQNEIAISDLKDTTSGDMNVKYSALVAEMKKYQTQLNEILNTQQQKRKLYSTVTNEGDKKFLEGIITDLEMKSLDISGQLDQAKKKVQEAELEFLEKGIIPVYNEPKPQKKDESKTVDIRFDKKSYSDRRNQTVEEAKPKIDLAFKVLDRAQVLEDGSVPEGLVYQIQLFVIANKAQIKQLKGLSPVYERKQPSGKYLYAVGAFRRYTDATAALAKVRRAGFPRAYVVAFNEGKSISTKTARTLEKKIMSTHQVVIGGYPGGLPQSIITAIRGASDKDIAKSVEDGQVIYLIGPFTDPSESESLKKILLDLGVKQVEIQPISNK